MKINLHLLKTLYLINRGSKTEAPMLNFILNYCRNLKNVDIEIDNEKNLFITKNTTNPLYMPCIIAHMDTVFDYDFERELVQKGNLITARDVKTKASCGLMADDSNGIYCALRLLDIIPNIKICFTTQEEIGGIGAVVATENTEFFNNVNFFLQADRRGNSNIITFTNGRKIVSDKFVEDITPIIKRYNYSTTNGIFTDVGEIAFWCSVSGINISCGYYNEHTTNETCNIVELHNCLCLMRELINTLKDKEPYKVEFAPNKDLDRSLLKYNDYFSYNTHDCLFEPLPCDTCSDMDCMNCTKTF